MFEGAAKCVKVYGGVWRYLELCEGELNWLEVCRGVRNV